MPLYVCTCTYRRCCDTINPRTGQPGVELSARTFKTHQNDEKNKDLKKRSEKAHAEALMRRDDSIDAALSRLTLSGNPVPLAAIPKPETQRSTKYKRDRVEEIVSYLSHEKDRIGGLIRDIDALASIPDDPPEIAVHEALKRCETISSVVEEIGQIIALSNRGAFRKEESVRFLREEARIELDYLLQRLKTVKKEWGRVLDEKEVRRQEFITQYPANFNSEHHFHSILEDAESIVQLVIFMIVACHVILGLSRRGCYWLFSMSQYLIETSVKRASSDGKTISLYFERIFGNFPRDVRAAAANFKLEGKSTVHAACIRCYAVYGPIYQNDIPTYPQRCNSSRYGTRCGELLTRPKKYQKHTIYVPLKPYVVFDFQDWFANMMSRNGYEKMMDDAWKKMPGDSSTEETPIEDIFQGDVVREFKGNNGKHFSQMGDRDSGRYLFSLGFDFFNPLRNLANGKKVSVGILAMICLNLPIELRNKPENIFLAAVIPGPKEPPPDAINHYVRPFVDMFLALWKGVYFSRTALFDHGRLVFCAIIAFICDLLAARKLGGFAACTHEYFCTVCWSNLTENTLADFSFENWKKRTIHTCRYYAAKYREATNEKIAASWFDRSGIRDSELLRLPYYDPTKHLVIDPMHNLFLGLIKEHFQNILGYRPKKKKGEEDDDEAASVYAFEVHPTDSNPVPSGKRPRAGVKRLVRLIRSSITFSKHDKDSFENELKQWHTGTIQISSLVYVGKAVGCLPETMTSKGKDLAVLNEKGKPVKNKKAELARILLTWRLYQQLQPMADTTRLCGRVFTEAEIQALWNDIDAMVKPSWATSVPTTISSMGPKLKSDQWRAVGSLYLPVTLIRLWSDSNSDLVDEEERTYREARRKILHLTMLLCSAIVIVTSRVVSKRHSLEYRKYMVEYRKELAKIFDNYKPHPNHHMAMHIGEFLSMYGPVYGWWTFPFERMIGNLQRIPTNYKEGEYEETIARTWNRSSNLKALFFKPSCPKPIRFCRNMFEKLVRPQNRNTLAYSSILDADEDEDDISYAALRGNSTKITTTLHHAFTNALGRRGAQIPSTANSMNHLSVAGISYTTSAVHEGNSGIFCKDHDIPLSIVNILEFEESSVPVKTDTVWLVVKRYRRASGIDRDPYARYPHLKAKVWSEDLEDSVEVVPLSSVKTHFAKCSVLLESGSYTVVVSLDRTTSV